MRKRMVILLSLTGLLLCGCQGREAPSGADPEGEAGMIGTADGAEASDAGGTEASDNSGTAGTTGTKDGGETEGSAGDADGGASEQIGKNADAGNEVVQGGPYGQLSLRIPEGWGYETYSADSEESYDNRYGIRFYPESAVQGYVELFYEDFFGVCGTGLESRDAVIAGNPVNIGTYDGLPYWNFIRFQGEMDGVTALARSVEDWWGTCGDQVTEILDTAVYNPDIREGAAWIFKNDSEIDEIGLNLSLKGISATGATLVFNQYDQKAPTGSLQFGDDFVLERCLDGKWQDVPAAVEGNYGFNAVAYSINPGGTTEKELDWEWLYGELAPGEYRISKGVDDFRGTGDFDQYTVYAYFILN